MKSDSADARSARADTNQAFHRLAEGQSIPEDTSTLTPSQRIALYLVSRGEEAMRVTMHRDHVDDAAHQLGKHKDALSAKKKARHYGSEASFRADMDQIDLLEEYLRVNAMPEKWSQGTMHSQSFEEWSANTSFKPGSWNELYNQRPLPTRPRLVLLTK